METKPTIADFARSAGISIGYACDILNGNRIPPRDRAISIFLRTGRKFGSIAALSDDDIATLVRIEGLAA